MNAVETSRSMGRQGRIARSEWWGQVLIIGTRVKTSDQQFIAYLRTNLSHLDDWVSSTGLKLEQRGSAGSLTATHEELSEICTRVSEDLSITLRPNVAHASLSTRPRRVAIEESSDVELRFRNPVSLNAARGTLRTLCQLLTLLMGRGAHPKSITVRRQRSNHNVEVYYPPAGHVAASDGRGTGGRRLSPISQQLSRVMNGWFSAAEVLRPVYDLHFVTVATEIPFLNQRFMNYVQGLEAFHRLTSSNRELPAAQHRARLKAIRTSAPEEHRSWLSEKLAFSNEPSLAKRIEALVTEFPLVLDGWPGTQQEFVRTVKHTRNWYTHFTPSLEPKAAGGPQLLDITDRLRRMLECCLLVHAGLDGAALPAVLDFR